MRILQCKNFAKTPKHVCGDTRGNCRGKKKKRVREDDSLQESTPLRKRKAVRKKLNLII